MNEKIKKVLCIAALGIGTVFLTGGSTPQPRRCNMCSACYETYEANIQVCDGNEACMYDSDLTLIDCLNAAHAE